MEAVLRAVTSNLKDCTVTIRLGGAQIEAVCSTKGAGCTSNIYTIVCGQIKGKAGGISGIYTCGQVVYIY